MLQHNTTPNTGYFYNKDAKFFSELSPNDQQSAVAAFLFSEREPLHREHWINHFLTICKNEQNSNMPKLALLRLLRIMADATYSFIKKDEKAYTSIFNKAGAADAKAAFDPDTRNARAAEAGRNAAIARLAKATEAARAEAARAAAAAKVAAEAETIRAEAAAKVATEAEAIRTAVAAKVAAEAETIRAKEDTKAAAKALIKAIDASSVSSTADDAEPIKAAASTLIKVIEAGLAVRAAKVAKVDADAAEAEAAKVAAYIRADEATKVAAEAAKVAAEAAKVVESKSAADARFADARVAVYASTALKSSNSLINPGSKAASVGGADEVAIKFCSSQSIATPPLTENKSEGAAFSR